MRHCAQLRGLGVAVLRIPIRGYERAMIKAGALEGAVTNPYKGL